MKLLICLDCMDVRALRIGRWMRCRCGRSRARYCDTIHAEVAGAHALLLGFQNRSLIEALRREVADRNADVARALGHTFEAFVIPFASPHVMTLKPRGRKSA